MGPRLRDPAGRHCGRQAAAVCRRHRLFHQRSREPLGAGPFGRCFLRRVRAGCRRGLLVHAPAMACRCGPRAMHSHPALRSARPSDGWVASWQDVVTGDQPTCRGESRSRTHSRRRTAGTPLGVSLHPTQPYESLAALGHTRHSSACRTTRSPFPGIHVSDLPSRLRPLRASSSRSIAVIHAVPFLK